MTSFSISGLSSGIDTASVISQLITVAAAPQTALKNQLSTAQNQLSAYQAINTKMAAVKSAADTLALASTWGATTATSSDSSIVASGSPNAFAGTATTLSVTAIAQAQVSTLTPADPTNAAVAANGLDVTVAGVATHVALAGSDVTAVASAINSASLGIRASVITASGGAKVLQFNAISTGAANSFTISGLSGALQTMTAAQDATVTVGTPGSGGYSLTSNTNTFTDAIPGVTFTVSKLTSNATISITSDSKSISDAVSALVTATNDALTVVGQASGKGAILAGDRTVSSLTQQLLGVVSAGTAGGKSFALVGVGMTSTGQLTFDAAAFATAYAKDPNAARAMAQTSLASSFSTAGNNATAAATGSLSQLITADNSQITSLTKQIGDWDTKLASQKTMLQTRYAAMEAALSKLKSQSSYLTSVFNPPSTTSK